MTSELHNQSQIAGDFSKELPKELKDIMVKIQQNK
jgi:hypothetical protein